MRKLKVKTERWGDRKAFRFPSPGIEIMRMRKAVARKAEQTAKGEANLIAGLKAGKVEYVVFKECVFPIVRGNENVRRLIAERDDLKRWFRRKSMISSLRQKMRDEIMAHHHYRLEEIFG